MSVNWAGMDIMTEYPWQWLCWEVDAIYTRKEISSVINYLFKNNILQPQFILKHNTNPELVDYIKKNNSKKCAYGKSWQQKMLFVVMFVAVLNSCVKCNRSVVTACLEAITPWQAPGHRRYSLACKCSDHSSPGMFGFCFL